MKEKGNNRGQSHSFDKLRSSTSASLERANDFYCSFVSAPTFTGAGEDRRFIYQLLLFFDGTPQEPGT